MSPFLSRRSLARTARVVAWAPALAALGACHQRSPGFANPSPIERDRGVTGRLSNGQSLPRFPGVDLVRTSGGGFYINILSGLVGPGQPLYVIDGQHMSVDRRHGIDWFKPEDIAEIKVLKNPTETAVYGAAGVNGVIVITTKRGQALQVRRG